ncbi:MAG TPA: hypothetical protein VE591_06265, partial [Candidatus Acidoferrum sp.]|nr:hypothetical protein [Candidatus Acidoferrum sp.]
DSPPLVFVEDDADRWHLEANQACEAAKMRGAFRGYLVRNGDARSDFDAAELIYGELIANCVLHAPGPVQVTFRWSERTLRVADSCERLQYWPFSPSNYCAEATHHGYRILRALVPCVRVSRVPGGTCASVVLPVFHA